MQQGQQAGRMDGRVPDYERGTRACSYRAGLAVRSHFEKVPICSLSRPGALHMISFAHVASELDERHAVQLSLNSHATKMRLIAELSKKRAIMTVGIGHDLGIYVYPDTGIKVPPEGEKERKQQRVVANQDDGEKRKET